MLAHLLDHFIFSSHRLSRRTKTIVFTIVAGAIVGTFWWFRNVAFGLDGPISDHWGLRWRKVSSIGVPSLITKTDSNLTELEHLQRLSWHQGFTPSFEIIIPPCLCYYRPKNT
jgi:hypothetical protein